MIGDPPKPKSPEPKILSFEEFIRRDPKWNHPHFNNFFLIFSRGGEIYRRHDFYKKFETAHPDMAASLCDKIQNQIDFSVGEGKALIPYDRDLYEAYKLLRGYGALDKDLGITE